MMGVKKYIGLVVVFFVTTHGEVAYAVPVLTKQSERLLSSGIGVAAGLGKLLHGYHRYGKTMDKRQVAVAVGMGALSAFIAHALLVQQTPEWQQEHDNKRLAYLVKYFADALTQSESSLFQIRELLPQSNQSIIDFARSVQNTPWFLCLMHNQLQAVQDSACRLYTSTKHYMDSLSIQFNSLISKALDSRKSEFIVSIDKLKTAYEQLLNNIKAQQSVIGDLLRTIINDVRYQTQLVHYRAHIAEMERAVQNHERDMLLARQAHEQNIVRINAQAIFNSQQSNLAQELSVAQERLQQSGQIQERNNELVCLVSQRGQQIELLQKTIQALEQRIATQNRSQLVSNVISGEECSICLSEVHVNDIQNPATTTMCRHIFHKECLRKALVYNNTCPNCRHPDPMR